MLSAAGASTERKVSKGISRHFQKLRADAAAELADETLVIDALPPMELHLQIKVVNRLYKELDVRPVSA